MVVLVGGLLLIGLVADADGLFASAGHALAWVAHDGWVLYAGAMLLVTAVTAVLNLDISVVFLTPGLIDTTRSRDDGVFSRMLTRNVEHLIVTTPSGWLLGVGAPRRSVPTDPEPIQAEADVR